MKAPKGHKQACRCPFCVRYRAAVKRRTRKPAATKRKAAKNTARRQNPATKKKGTLGTWVKATAVRVRKVAGQLFVDVKR